MMSACMSVYGGCFILRVMTARPLTVTTTCLEKLEKFRDFDKCQEKVKEFDLFDCSALLFRLPVGSLSSGYFH